MTSPERLNDAYRHTQLVTKEHAKTFYFASAFLPQQLRLSIRAVYAFCRTIDDLADESPDRQVALEQLNEINATLDERIRRPGDDLLYIALSDAVQRHGIPTAYFRILLSGIRMDFSQTRYKNFAELYRYCYRVAGIVGLMVAKIFGYSDPRVRKLVTYLGIGMQLTNILRDVGEDMERDRIYIPREDLRKFHVTEDQIFRREVNEDFVRLMTYQILRARHFYQRGSRALEGIRGRVRITTDLSVRLYARILDKIVENNYNVLSKRASVPLGEKILAVPSAFVDSI